jgi:hypothetical protein
VTISTGDEVGTEEEEVVVGLGFGGPIGANELGLTIGLNELTDADFEVVVVWAEVVVVVVETTDDAGLEVVEEVVVVEVVGTTEVMGIEVVEVVDTEDEIGLVELEIG